jgi:hypothetical protein
MVLIARLHSTTQCLCSFYVLGIIFVNKFSKLLNWKKRVLRIFWQEEESLIDH